MSCCRPFQLPGRYSLYGGLVDLPCGKCLSCRLDTRTIWSNRLTAEWTSNKYCAFVTFTYDDNHCPVGLGVSATVRRADMRKYLDRLRHYVKYHLHEFGAFAKADFKYFVVSEYGEKGGRPHYHALFFGLDYHACKKLFKKTWKFGLVDVRPILKGGIRYVLKYLDKQQHYDDLEHIYLGQECNFRLVSNGLGKEVFIKHLDDINKYGMMKFGQRLVCFPTYWRNKYVEYSPQLIANMVNAHERYETQLATECSRLGYGSLDAYKLYKKRQKEKRLISISRRNGESVKDLLLEDSQYGKKKKCKYIQVFHG